MQLNRRELLLGATAGALVMSSTAHAKPVVDVPPFTAPTAKDPMLLCFNENPLGMSLKAKVAAKNALDNASRYPFIRVEALRAACAKFMGGKPENVMPSHGSAESIRAVIEAYLTPETQFVVPALTYSDGEDTARKNGHTRITKVPMGKNWSIDLEGLKKAVASYKGPSIVYFVNPNNPTSTIVDSKALLNWIRSKPANTMFVIDEAYAEFVNAPGFVSAKVLVDEGYENLCVLKTFSKIFAMAGMRLGFTYAAPSVIKKARAHVAYDVMMNTCSIEAALAEITDKEFLKVSRDENAKARKILTDALDELKIDYLKSQTNFVFMDLKAPLKPFMDRMKAENIMVGRPFPPATTWCRISLGTPDQMRYFVKKLKEFRQKNWI